MDAYYVVKGGKALRYDAYSLIVMAGKPVALGEFVAECKRARISPTEYMRAIRIEVQPETMMEILKKYGL